MSERTLSSMHDARDAEDRRLLDEKNHKYLLAAYFDQVRERCFLRLRDRDAADDAAQQVFLRLANELERGRTYPVPYRVVVHKVTDWVLRGFYPGTKQDRSLPENWDPVAPDAYDELEQDLHLERLLAELPQRQREVAELLYVEGLSPDQIAGRLGLKRNAVDQAAHNARKKLLEKLRA